MASLKRMILYLVLVGLVFGGIYLLIYSSGYKTRAGSSKNSILEHVADVPVDNMPSVSRLLRFSDSGNALIVEQKISASMNIWEIQKVISIRNGLSISDSPSADGKWRVDGEIVSANNEREFLALQRPPARGEYEIVPIQVSPTPYEEITIYIKARVRKTIHEAQSSLLTPDGYRFENSLGECIFPDQPTYTYTADFSSGRGWPGRRQVRVR